MACEYPGPLALGAGVLNDVWATRDPVEEGKPVLVQVN